MGMRKYNGNRKGKANSMACYSTIRSLVPDEVCNVPVNVKLMDIGTSKGRG